MKHEKVFHAYLEEGSRLCQKALQAFEMKNQGRKPDFVSLKSLNFRICDFCGFRIQFLDFFYQIVMTNMQ